MATWPATLPPPAINTFREKPPQNTIRSTMDKGPDKTRRRTTANIRPISFTLKLTPEQVQALDDFFNITTFSGADEFDYTHPRTGDSVTVRFASEPDYAEVEGGVIYNCSISLEIMP